MLLNEAERLGVLQGQTLQSFESALTELRWSAFESWIWLFGDRIYEARFRPKGSLGENSGAGRQEESLGRRTADEDLAPEKVTFYAMLLNEEVELGVAHDFTAESMKSSLIGLRWLTFEVWMDCADHALRGAQLHRPADEVEVHGSQDEEEEGSGSTGPPAPSSDGE
ncbi:hypothetical protein Cgig2_021339 [Carnegiea gigantea]|uniref:Uncharacterized protein n=1 Tax=Carnegiea gigantea TaxID=171969 RepID=A0A9Q1GTZ7_9CARY|nr:hypothetical protein Cgig2_021339 [Carnegiea gigantea]